jgi:hypothetical protein
MQPPAESGFGRAEHINQRGLGVAMNPGLGGSVFPDVNGGQSYSLPRQKPEIYPTISYRSVSLGYGIAGARTKVVRRKTDVAAVAGYAASCGTSRSTARVRGSAAPIRVVVRDL